MSKKPDYTTFTDAEKKLLQLLSKHRDHAAKKFPLGFALIATFGLVATLQGFQKLIERIPLLAHNPWISLAVGVSTLIASGAVYRKLG
jgi:hypothetical protein